MKKEKIEKIIDARISTYRKCVITLLSVSALTVASSINVSAETPENVNITSLNTIITLVFWIVGVAIAAAAVVPGIYHIAQGVANEDPRTRNSGIASAVIGAICIAALPAVKAAVFDGII